MMSPPADVTVGTAPQMVQLWAALTNATWMPINIHRLIANVVFGGAVVGAYAAYRFLAAKSDEERAHYDWMGYVGNMTPSARSSFCPSPATGLAGDLRVQPADGHHHDGWLQERLWIIQAFLIGILFLAGITTCGWGWGEYPGGALPALHEVHAGGAHVGVIVWATPNTDRQPRGVRGDGRHAPPLPERARLMSGKNTAVNFMILTTFLSFLLYRRANKGTGVPWRAPARSCRVRSS